MRLFIIILTSLSLHSQNTIESISYADYLNIDNSNDFIVIDVRTPEEYKIKRIKNSININFYDEKFIHFFKIYEKDENILIYCRSGRRSLEAVKNLSKKGFKNIYDLKGGILALDKSLVDFDSLND
ncbi:MAG: rhodanese [Flavobacteriales bacterium]|nr:rhodanese [Flavobacteriales bacterium]